MIGRSGYYQSGGAFGFRDQLQDTLGLKFLNPDILKRQIIYHSKHQFLEGDVEHWWHEESKRGIRTKISDDLLWMVYVVIEYINFTGDKNILYEETEYLKGNVLKDNEEERYEKYSSTSEKESIFKHCIRAIDKSLNFGKNGLPKIGTGDWNDGLNKVGNKGNGESVWLGFFLYYILHHFSKICEELGEKQISERYERIKEELKKKLNTNAWDGRWYRRAFTDEGNILGSIQNEECRIDSIAQSWSVISNAGDNDKKFIAMESLDSHLIDWENGIIKLLDPPFEKCNINPGYIKSYLPGVRENGGQYTHAAIWVIIAECLLGFKDKAEELFEMINPIEHSKTKEMIKKYKVEPYVMSADIYGRENLIGQGGWSWYTGSASWYYKVGIEYIVGLKIENGYMKIEPNIPVKWKEVDIKYKYKKTTYNIHINNENIDCKIEYIKINGIKEKNNIKLDGEEEEYFIEVG